MFLSVEEPADVAVVVFLPAVEPVGVVEELADDALSAEEPVVFAVAFLSVEVAAVAHCSAERGAAAGVEKPFVAAQESVVALFPDAAPAAAVDSERPALASAPLHLLLFAAAALLVSAQDDADRAAQADLDPCAEARCSQRARKLCSVLLWEPAAPRDACSVRRDWSRAGLHRLAASVPRAGSAADHSAQLVC